VCDHANGPDQSVGISNWRGCRGSCHSPPGSTEGRVVIVNDDVKAAIDEIANSLQVISLLSTRLRQDLGESAQQAVDLEGATARAVRAMKRLLPDGKKKR
jgi:hypothetical protein